MMLYPARTTLTSYVPNRYMLVNVVARRARQIAEIAEENGEFYLVSGFESAMAYTMSFSDFIVGKLVREKLPEEYVKMRNSL